MNLTTIETITIESAAMNISPAGRGAGKIKGSINSF